MSGNAYTCEPQQRLLRLLLVLAGNEVDGLPPGEIAKLQSCSASLVTRDLANLAEGGFAERVPANGHWRLSPVLVQIANRYVLNLERASARLAETTQRYTRS